MLGAVNKIMDPVVRPRPHKALRVELEVGKHRALGGTEERPLTWALEVGDGFLGKLTSELGPRGRLGGRQERNRVPGRGWGL